MKAKRKATGDRLLDAAERLFAKQGIRATSLREITAQSKSNLAAVNYHFRSKDALVRAVFERCFRPLNEERLRCLAAAEDAAGNGPLAIEAVLRALFEPMLVQWRLNRNFILLAGRLQHEPDARLHQFILSLYEELIRRFLSAAKRAAPGVPEPDLFFWLQFLFGGTVHTLLQSEDLERLSGGFDVLSDTDVFLDRLIAFGAAGLNARIPPAERSTADSADLVPKGGY